LKGRATVNPLFFHGRTRMMDNGFENIPMMIPESVVSLEPFRDLDVLLSERRGG